MQRMARGTVLRAGTAGTLREETVARANLLRLFIEGEMSSSALAIVAERRNGKLEATKRMRRSRVAPRSSGGRFGELSRLRDTGSPTAIRRTASPSGRFYLDAPLIPMKGK
jgi:hypothetical protein